MLLLLMVEVLISINYLHNQGIVVNHFIHTIFIVDHLAVFLVVRLPMLNQDRMIRSIVIRVKMGKMLQLCLIYSTGSIYPP